MYELALHMRYVHMYVHMYRQKSQLDFFNSISTYVYVIVPCALHCVLPVLYVHIFVNRVIVKLALAMM